MKRIKRAITGLVLCGLCYGVWADIARDLRDGREAYRKKDVARLAQISADMDGSLFANYGRYWLISSQIQQIDKAVVKQYLRDYSDSYLANNLRGEWLKAMGERADWSEFASEYPKVYKPEQDLQCYQLQAQQAANAADVAYLRAAKALWLTEKDLPSACTPVFNGLFKAQHITTEDLWRRIRLALESDNLNFAEYLNQIFPAGQGFDASLLKIAANKPQQFVQDYAAAGSGRGTQELLVFALSRIGKKEPQQAVDTLQALGDQLPQARAEYAWGLIAAHAARNLEPMAATWFTQADTKQLADRDLEWMARIALRAGNWTLVQYAIEDMSPELREQNAWQYWLARAYKQHGRMTDANKMFTKISQEIDFYGVLAGEELASVIDTPAKAYYPTPDEVAAVANRPGIQRALALYDAGATTEGRLEWNWAVRQLDDASLLAAAQWAERQNRYDRSIFAADRTQKVHNFNLRYPTPYYDIMRQYAPLVDLDPAWAYGIIRQESRFTINAKSNVGAQGLMQVMPATGKWMAGKMGLKGYHGGMLSNMYTNVHIGTHYLKYVQNDLLGSEVLATAAYNAGPSRARKWQAAMPLEGAIYAESIPFSETRDYVKNVMANTYYYSRVLGQPKPSLKKHLGVIPARAQ